MIKSSLKLGALLVAFATVQCTTSPQKEVAPPETTTKEKEQIKEVPTPIAAIEKAHGKAGFYANQALSFDIRLNWGGKERLNATLTLLTNSTKGLIAAANGDTILFNHGKVFYSDNMEDPSGVRFSAYTWSYFFLFPFKLTDPGTKWSEFGTTEMHGEMYNTQKLSFEAGTGDAPDDWYFAYSNPNTNLLHGAAYIVTANKSVEKAESNPHAITYENYKEVQGIPLATAWRFWEWNKADGMTEEIGNASLSNFQFKNIDEAIFEPKANFLEAK